MTQPTPHNQVLFPHPITGNAPALGGHRAGSKAFLDRFPAARRSWANGLFLRMVRGGATTPTAVLAGVWAAVEDYEPERADLLAGALTAHAGEALALAEHALGWEALPPEQRAAVKAASAEGARRAYLDAQAPTLRQLDYIRRLGSAAKPATRLEASRLIDALQRERRGGRNR